MFGNPKKGYKKHRRNPGEMAALAGMAGNPKKKRYYRAYAPKKGYRRNPRVMGMGGIDLLQIAAASAGFVGGIAVARALKVKGAVSYLAVAGTGIVAGMLGGRLIGRRISSAIMTGSLVAVATMVVNDYIFKGIVTGDPAKTMADLGEDVDVSKILSGYVKEPGVSGYVSTKVSDIGEEAPSDMEGLGETRELTSASRYGG